MFYSSLATVEVMPIQVRLIGGTFMLAMGSLFGFLGVWMSRESYKKLTKWHVTYGTVVGFGTGGSMRTTTCRREVEFQAPGGEKVVFTESTGSASSSRKHSIGRKVKVRYSPDDPTKADIPTASGLWIFPLFFLFVGAVFLFMSFVFYAGLSGKK